MVTEGNPISIKHSPTRRAIAQQIWTARRMEDQVEENKRYEMDRGMRGYESALYGLEHFLDYARSLGTSGVILDVGSGTTRGIKEISQSPIGQGLSYTATGLSMNAEIDNFIGLENYRNTSVEILRGIENNSVAGVTAVNSLAYSAEPVVAIQRIDEVLVPGGVIKASFRNREKIAETLVNAIYRQPVFQTSLAFIPALVFMGYDVALTENTGEYEVIVAIKPGGKGDIAAEQLLARDKYALDVRNLQVLKSTQELVVDDQVQSKGVSGERLVFLIHGMLENIGIPYDEEAIDASRAIRLLAEIERIRQEFVKRDPNINAPRLKKKKISPLVE